MGLTIHYKLAVAEKLSSAVVRELVQRAAHYARKIGCAEAGEVMLFDPDMPFPSFLYVGPRGGLLLRQCSRQARLGGGNLAGQRLRER